MTMDPSPRERAERSQKRWLVALPFGKWEVTCSRTCLTIRAIRYRYVGKRWAKVDLSVGLSLPMIFLRKTDVAP